MSGFITYSSIPLLISCCSKLASVATFDLSGLAEAVDIYSHVNFDIPVIQDDSQDAIGDVDPEYIQD